MDAYLATQPALLVSDLAQAEFAATVGVRLRQGKVERPAALDALLRFQRWSGDEQRGDQRGRSRRGDPMVEPP